MAVKTANKTKTAKTAKSTKSSKPYEYNGVHLSKKTFYSGDKLTVVYDGLLAKAGAQSIYLHMGYGDDWSDKELLPMTAEGDGVFKAELTLSGSKKFSLCFKDSAENWDNNSGENYQFRISARRTKKE